MHCRNCIHADFSNTIGDLAYCNKITIEDYDYGLPRNSETRANATCLKLRDIQIPAGNQLPMAMIFRECSLPRMESYWLPAAPQLV